MAKKMKKKRLMHFVGKKKGGGTWDREHFTSRRIPTEKSHGHKYGYVMGPYSKAEAERMVK
jgi:hypothetical protein